MAIQFLFNMFSIFADCSGFVCQCVLSVWEVMLPGPTYTTPALSLPASLSLNSVLPSLPPSFNLFQGQSPSVKPLFLVLCNFLAFQNEFAYGK